MTTIRRVYIAGCGGMLGDACHDVFSRALEVKATDINRSEPWVEFADVRDYHAIAQSIEAFQPDAIVNLAALTDMEQCERDPRDAWLTNALGAENLGLIAARLNIPYVYISTAGIFAGDQEFYTDFDTPAPRSVYARSKYAGELFTSTNVPRHFVVRAGWMMGGGPAKDKKFINKIYRQIRAGSRSLQVVQDKSGTPTYTVDFAAGLQRLLGTDLYGVYNQVCGGSGTRFDVAREFVRCLGLQDEVQVEPVTSDYFATEYFAYRPESEQLVNWKLTARGLNRMRDWKVCLEEYSAVYLNDLHAARATAAAGK